MTPNATKNEKSQNMAQAVSENAGRPVMWLSDAIARHVLAHPDSLGTVAHRAGMYSAQLQSLADGGSNLRGTAPIEAVARALNLPPSQLREYRLAVVLDSMSSNLELLREAFLATMSPIERELIGDATFCALPLSETVKRLLVKHEMTQQELAEGIGVAQPVLSRLLNGHDRASVDLIETIAQALDVAPEVFVEYRMELVDDWLRQHPNRLDEFFDALHSEPLLAKYDAWTIRRLAAPLDSGPHELLKSLVDIVQAEGPVMAARVYELRLAASCSPMTKVNRSILNRATAAASRVGLLLDVDELDDQTQIHRILRVQGQASMIRRVLGGRQLWQVPPRELESVIQLTPAWKRGDSVTRIQDAVVSTYGVSHVSPRDTEHLNHCIMSCRKGGNACRTGGCSCSYGGRSRCCDQISKCHRRTAEASEEGRCGRYSPRS